MPIGGSATELIITGAKLKVSGNVEVSGSIAYTTDAFGFGGVTAQIDNNNTLNITSGKLTGVTKIDRSTAATITAITHTNVNNNTTIHIALKNTSTANGANGGIFITFGTFAGDDTVKVNYTDDYVISPQETSMLTLRKVDGVLSVFMREMFTTDSLTFDSTKNRPFYIKDGVNYKYPLYTASFPDAVTNTIGGTQYYVRSTDNGGVISKSRPPKGLPELIVTPSGNLAIGNNGAGTTVNYDVWGVTSSFDFGTIYQGTTKKARFVLENGEASGSFTESAASSGDAYSLSVDKIVTSVSDTVTFDENAFLGTIAFHHGAFSSSDYSSAYSTVGAAATAGFIYSDTSTTPTYTWGTLNSVDTSTSGQTEYSWTPPSDIDDANVLIVAGGGGGGGNHAGGGGAGGLLYYTKRTITGQKTIVVGEGGAGGYGYNSGQTLSGTNGGNTSFLNFTSYGGGGGGGGSGTVEEAKDGGSGGGSRNGSSTSGSGTPGQGFSGGSSSADGGGGGGGAGGTGSGTSNANGGDGGVGQDHSGVFGTTYGDFGWFASGGGGGSRSSIPGESSAGGGGAGSVGTLKADDGQKHTGGGGGAAHYSGASDYELGGRGGSGIVMIKSNGVGKVIPKVVSLSTLSTSNVIFTTEGTSIDKISYSLDNGTSFSTTSSGELYPNSVTNIGTTGELKTVVTYPIDSNGIRLSVNRSYTKRISTFPNALGLFLDLGTTLRDSDNDLYLSQYTGSYTHKISTNSILNTSSVGPGTLFIDFTSKRASATSDVTISWEVYLLSGKTWNGGFSLGNISATSTSADSVGYLGATNPTLHYASNGQTNQQLNGSNISYTTYENVWVKHTWMYVSGSNAIKTYINGALACSASPNSGTFEPESYFWVFCHAQNNNTTSYVADTGLICRNIEIYGQSFTDAEILAAYGS